MTVQLIIGVAVLALLAATGLILFGLRGRLVNDHPICRACGFDLVGLKPDAPACPECGRNLADPRAIRRGERRRRRHPLLAGLALLLIVLAGAGLIIWGQASGYDWNRLKPVALLLYEAKGTDETTADKALKELQARQTARTLSDSQTASIVKAALAYQADAPRPWRYRWGDLIEVERLGERLSDEDFAAYARHAVVPEFLARKTVRVGAPVSAVLVMNCRSGSNDVLVCDSTRKVVRIGSQRVGMGPGMVSFGLNCRPMGPSSLSMETRTFHLIPEYRGTVLGMEPTRVTFDQPGEIAAMCKLHLRVSAGSYDRQKNRFVTDEPPGIVG